MGLWMLQGGFGLVGAVVLKVVISREEDELGDRYNGQAVNLKFQFY